MNLLFVVEHYHPYLGGAEKLFQQLAASLAERGYNVMVITTRHHPSLAAEETYQGVHIIRVPCFNRFLFTLFSLPMLWRKRKFPDLIITSTYNAALPAWLIGRLANKKTLLIFHELWGKLWFQLPFLTRLQRWLFFTYEQMIARLPFSHYIAVSDATKRSLIANGIPAQRISRIYNGLVYERFANLTREPSSEFRALYFGRLGVSKGLDLIIPAWEKFAAQYPQSRLELVVPMYPAKLYGQIKVLIDKHLSNSNSTVYHELPESELQALVRRSSVVLIPSYSEGFCFAAAEASAAGVPIISSGRGSLPEVVGGSHLQMEQQTVEGLYSALEKAYQGRWLNSPRKMFPLSEAIEQYVALIQRWKRE